MIPAALLRATKPERNFTNWQSWISSTIWNIDTIKPEYRVSESLGAPHTVDSVHLDFVSDKVWINKALSVCFAIKSIKNSSRFERFFYYSTVSSEWMAVEGLEGEREEAISKRKSKKGKKSIYFFVCLCFPSKTIWYLSWLAEQRLSHVWKFVGLGSAVGLLHVRLDCKSRISVSTFVSLTSTVQMRIKCYCFLRNK